MTRILFFPDERTEIRIESSLPPGELLAAIGDGTWKPPPPYNALPAPLRAIQVGGRIILAPLRTAERCNDFRGMDIETRSAIRLSRRQRQVLQGLAEGLTTKEIAQRLGLKTRMVVRHAAALKRRIGTNTMAQSVGRAAALGLLDD